MENRVAAKWQIWVCAACGKRSKDRYGEQAVDQGWDASCATNAVLCFEQKSAKGKYVVVPAMGTEAIN